MRQHRDAYHESLKSVLGAPPDPAPLTPEILQSEMLAKYRREKVRYQVQPGDWSYAYVLIPYDAPEGMPAVYCHHRHNQEWKVGKSEVVGLMGDPDEAFGAELAERGYLVFAPDAISFEDRRPSEDDGADNNFRELSVRLLRGETLLKKVVWDVSRGIDYLETRPEINKKRIGFVGHGYGARMAMWALAFDERLALGVAHGSISSMHQALKLGHTIQYEFTVPRLLQVVDYDRVLSLAAPRPFLVSATIHDPDSTDASEVFEKAHRAYIRMGVENRLDFYHYHDGNIDEPWFTVQARHRVYDWLDSWLKPY
jgi:dienelactone hydrolase